MSDKPIGPCKQFSRLMAAQRKLLKRHLPEHKWCNHIADENLGALDFIDKFGWILRETFCDNVCPDRGECGWAKAFLPKEEETGEEQKTVPDQQPPFEGSPKEVRYDDVGFDI